jgi:non-ribosomal peptide synthetase component F
MVLLAVYQSLMCIYSGQEDVVVGVPIAGRVHERTESLIGFFVNTLALRGDLSGRPTFRDILQRVRDSTLRAYSFQYLPFERLVMEVRPERDPAQQPFFQVMLALHNYADARLRLPGTECSRIDFGCVAAQCDLTLHLFRSGDGALAGLRGRLEYATDIFEEATVRRMQRHFCLLLERVTADPDALIR